MKQKDIAFFWHRRDLRIEDNRGLFKALTGGCTVLPIFIFDTKILDQLPNKRDARVLFIHQELKRLKVAYQQHGSDLKVFHGSPLEVWKKLVDEYAPKSVYTNRDYEPYALERDKELHAYFTQKGIDFKGSKDHVIFEKSEVEKLDGGPYTVFTPFSKRWKLLLEPSMLEELPSSKSLGMLHPCEAEALISLEKMGFEDFDFSFPNRDFDTEVIERYGERRDLPAVRGTSRLSVHLRFGTISIRAAARKALEYSETWLNELIWRDFYQAVIYHFPHSAQSAFKPAYDRIPWRQAPEDFERWCEGKTGYPLVDAGMRELNATGFMHNRVRMVTASFLTKHLLIDWRLGEAYFAEKLLDYELASNVGGWQWAAGSGCDAAPYFRVFNPTAQQEKFDPNFAYIRKWVPEFGSEAYPSPMVEHKSARIRAIETYKAALA